MSSSISTARYISFFLRRFSKPLVSDLSALTPSRPPRRSRSACATPVAFAVAPLALVLTDPAMDKEIELGHPLCALPLSLPQASWRVPASLWPTAVWSPHLACRCTRDVRLPRPPSSTRSNRPPIQRGGALVLGRGEARINGCRVGTHSTKC